MKDSCGVDMSKTSNDMSTRILVTTIPLDQSHHRAKLLNMNSTQLVALVVVVLISVIVLVDRYGQMKRIGQLERKQDDQEALIRELIEGLQSLRDRVDQTPRYGTTEASEQLQKNGTSNERESQSEDRVTRHNLATVVTDGTGQQLSKNRRGKVQGEQYLKRIKRPAADHHSSGRSTERSTTKGKRKGTKKERKNKNVKRCRQDNSTCGTPTCEFVNECNEARHGGRSNCNHFVAQFEQPSESNQLIGCQRDVFNDQFVSCNDDVIGNWEHASWTLEEHRHKLRIKSRLENFPNRPRKSTIEVKETGIYYIYSQIALLRQDPLHQITFADDSSFLGHSVLIDDEIKFTCSLWVTDVQANTCTTGGLVKIEANQLIHIQMIERNRIINMDSANTFFGIMQMMAL